MVAASARTFRNPTNVNAHRECGSPKALISYLTPRATCFTKTAVEMNYKNGTRQLNSALAWVIIASASPQQHHPIIFKRPSIYRLLRESNCEPLAHCIKWNGINPIKDYQETLSTTPYTYFGGENILRDVTTLDTFSRKPRFERTTWGGNQNGDISFQSSYQRVYESLCIIALSLPHFTHFTYFWKARAQETSYRHSLHCNHHAQLLECASALVIQLLGSTKIPTLSEDNDEQNLPTHIACRINGVLTSYLQTVIPSFAAAFVGEALRITWQVSKITRPKPPSPLPDSTLSTRQALVLAKPRMDPEKKASVHFEENSSSDFSNTVRKWEHVVFVETHSMSNRKDNSWEIVESPDTSTSPSHRNHSKGKFLSFNPGTEGKWPFVLCLVPTLCGLPQLVLILVSYLQVGKAWIFRLMLSILFRMRRSATHSIAGCLVVAVMYFTSKDKYHEALDLFGVINPIASALILTDWEIFTIWNRWIRGSISFIMACLGLNGLQITNTGLPATLSNHISTKYRQSNKSKRAADGSWSPPKPSYNRSHRLVSMSSVADSDIYERETSSPGVAKPVLRQDVGVWRIRRAVLVTLHPLRGKDEVFVPLIIRIVANILPIHQWSLELLGTPPLSQKTDRIEKARSSIL
ncbi:hypothetical protein KEM48_002249 [Puccinia striiformis f. sp. tritici PST-130]|nr:hypothetical protein KEM48_002249 [Puccinia striiformis f. sp. tritici PST-130]